MILISIISLFTGSVAGQCIGGKMLQNCKARKCDIYCKATYGPKAYGTCFFYYKPNDTCKCDYPCWALD